MKKLVFISLFLFINPAFADDSVTKRPDAYQTDKESKQLPVYETNFSDKPFTIVGKVNVKASTLKELSNKIRKLAAKYEGDAVLSYRIQNTGAISWWTGGQISYAEGIIIKFDDNGMKKIDAAVPIPVLE